LSMELQDQISPKRKIPMTHTNTHQKAYTISYKMQ